MKLKHPMGFSVSLYQWRAVLRAWIVHYRVKLRFFLIYLKNSLISKQCPIVIKYSGRRRSQCCLIAGHSGEHRLLVDKNADN